MKAYSLNEIREKYLEFFESKGHLRLPSFPLVPINDNSLLLVNSGMAPLKPYFTGDEIPPRKRVTTCQKCIRTPDIDNVGKTARHGTFFEMLGNFSFGDYFKTDAIKWGWEFVTKTMEIPEEKLYVSIYENDDEAYEIWNKIIGLAPDKIVRLGKEDNFWEHGLGPCGPCSEIYFDRGEVYGCDSPNCAVGCNCDRYIEFWNLVFTQFDKDENGNYNPLANPNIDTGMGLERIATIMQGVNTIFEVDTIQHILNYVCNLAGVEYGVDEKIDISIRVITDHVRSVAFMVGDGVLPSNEGRGYVLRRLLRRAARHGKLLGIENTFLFDIAKEVEKVSGKAYPEVTEKLDYIMKVIKIEEERFQETIDQGLIILQEEIEILKKNNEEVLLGSIAFKLYDTFGFPLDLTKDILLEQNMTLVEEDFNIEMKKQRERARKARLDSDIEVWKDDPFAYVAKSIKTNFIGYDNVENTTEIIGLVNNGKPVEKVSLGDEVLILLKDTTFYAESGGQVGDKGKIISETGAIEVYDCKKGSLNRHVHYGKVSEGEISVNQIVESIIDKSNRLSIARNHTTTHLLQKALKEVLGDHVAQAGSLVSSDKLRFDFNHFQKLSNEEVKKVEDRVNEKIMESLTVEIFETDIETAKKIGATALFGEKYGEVVRVVKIEDYSVELCGGTHLKNISQTGLFKIISENGVAAGIRRIEAATGINYLKYIDDMEESIIKASVSLKTTPDNLEQRIIEITNNIKELEKDNELLRKKVNQSLIGNNIDKIEEICGIKTIITEVDNANMDDLRDMGDKFRDKLQSGIVLLATQKDEKVNFIAMATKDIVSKGFHAGNLVRDVAKITGGGGGGRPDMAQAGGKDSSKLQEALQTSRSIIEKQLTS